MAVSNNWRAQSDASQSILDSLKPIIQGKYDVFLSQMNDANPDSLKRQIAELESDAKLIDEQVDLCNKIVFPQTPEANNEAALLNSKLSQCGMFFTACLSQIRVNADIERSKNKSGIDWKELLKGLLEFVVSQYVPVFK